MKIFVKYNNDGEILSVSKVDVMPEGLDQPYVLDENEFVLVAPGKKEFVNLDAIQLHEGYKVDVKKARLVKKT